MTIQLKFKTKTYPTAITSLEFLSVMKLLAMVISTFSIIWRRNSTVIEKAKILALRQCISKEIVDDNIYRIAIRHAVSYGNKILFTRH